MQQRKRWCGRHMVGAVGLALIGSAAPACVASSGEQGVEVGKARQAVIGTVSFDESCRRIPTSHPELNISPDNVMRNIEIAQAYMRIAASSPAFRECMSTAMQARTPVRPSRGPDAVGPYFACAGDPAPATIDGVMAHALATNGTRIYCDYNTVGGSTGGYAGVGAIDPGTGNELFTMGNRLPSLNAPAHCAFNPDGLSCVSNATYSGVANTVMHEILHAQGYSHVSDFVWGLNDIIVGDVRDDNGYTFTLADFCGVAPTATRPPRRVPNVINPVPPPGIHPSYTTSIPYMAGICMETVLDWSQTSGALNRDCGPDFPGFAIADSVLRGSAQTMTSTCVRDPYSGAPYASRGGAPVPPHAPTGCETHTTCGSRNVSFSCNENANPVRLERRRLGTSTWVASDALYRFGFEYRACAESLYGRACTRGVDVRPVRFCFDEIQYPDPIPFWRWPSWLDGLALRDVAEAPFAGGVLAAMPIPKGEGGAFGGLVGGGGDLSSQFDGLVVGVYDPHNGRFPLAAPSIGDLPPGRGTAFAALPSSKELPTLFALGGVLEKGDVSPWLYVGQTTYGKGIPPRTSWTRTPLDAGGPGARANAAWAASSTGGRLVMFGGRGPNGVNDDLWSYEPTGNAWTLVASGGAFGGREGASVAAASGSVYVHGGHGSAGNLEGDLWIWSDDAKGVVAHTKLTPRAGATLVLAGGKLYVYGGEAVGGPSDLLEVVDPGTGKLVDQQHLQVTSAYGGALSVDPDGGLVLVPSPRNTEKSGGAFAGLPGALQFVPEVAP